MNLHDEIFHIFYSEGQPVQHHFKTDWLIKKQPELYNKILQETDFLPEATKISERVYCILNEIKQIPKCYCGNDVKYRPSEKRYLTYCSTKCSNSQKNFTPFSDPNIQNKIKQTNLEKYGVENVFSSKEIQDKIKQTNLEKYGTEHPMKSGKIKQKVLKTQIKKYGKLYVYTKEFLNKKKAYQENIFDENTKIKIENMEFLYKEHYENDKTISQIARELGVSFTAVWERFQKFNIDARFDITGTNVENEIDRFLKQNQLHFEKNTRKIIPPKELDFYLPDCNLAIEINGIYFHSTKFRNDKNYHLNKTSDCKNKGIKLLQFYDTEWIEKQKIIESMILYRCGIVQRYIMARKTVVKDVDKQMAKQFFENNHIQGHQNFTHCIGLFHDYELIACMSFIKNRTNSQCDWELLRFATLKHTHVMGGASKLFKYFCNNLKKESESIVSYADLRYSNGNLYERLGFEKIRQTKPSYQYLIGGKLFHRRSYQKKLLERKNLIYDRTLTEEQNLLNNKIYRVYNCGQLVFVYK